MATRRIEEAGQVSPLDEIYIGKPGAPRARYVEMFHQRGLHRITPDRLSLVRTGHLSGVYYQHELRAQDTLNAGSSPKKDKLYLSVINPGVNSRYPQASSPERHSSVGLTKAMTWKSGLTNEQVLRRCLRAARADALYSIHQGGLDGDGFLDAVDEFLGDFSNGTPRSFKSLQEFWKANRSLSDFYRAIAPLPRTFSAWLPYELDPLKAFYHFQYAHASLLTPFDRLVLEVYRGGDEQIIAETRQVTGIGLDKAVIDTHINALLYGKPLNPHRANAPA